MYDILHITAGSHLYNLVTSLSDKDIRGIIAHDPSKYLDPRSTAKDVVKEHHSNRFDGMDYEGYTVRHWLRELGKGTPEAFELLYAPEEMVYGDYSSHAGWRLRRMRDALLHEQVLHRLIHSSGFVAPNEVRSWLQTDAQPRNKNSQLTKAVLLWKEEGQTHKVNKLMADVCRRMWTVTNFLKTGEYNIIPTGVDRMTMMHIKTGYHTMTEALTYRNDLFYELCTSRFTDIHPSAHELKFKNLDIPETLSDTLHYGIIDIVRNAVGI